VAITEESRYRLYQRLEELLGQNEAATLMEHLPPVGWADVATKRDLEQSVAMMKRDLDHGLDSLGNVLRVEFAREQRNLVFAMVAANSTLAAISFAAARLV
jgi:hypothetical protein